MIFQGSTNKALEKHGRLYLVVERVTHDTEYSQLGSMPKLIPSRIQLCVASTENFEGHKTQMPQQT